MKWLFLFILVLHANCKLFAQDRPDSLITSLVNSVYLQRVDSAAKFYYLYEKGTNIEFNKYELADLVNDNVRNKKLLQSIPIAELSAEINKDTTSINWSNYSLINAKCVLRKNYQYSYSQRIIKVLPLSTPDSTLLRLKESGILAFRAKSNLSKKQLENETDKALAQYEKDTPLEEKNFYRFSKPVFSKDKRYALIALNGSERGCLYIFENIDGKWAKVLQFNCWVV